MAATVQETMATVNETLQAEGGAYATYSCKTVSWDDVQRGEVGGSLSCWGGNITDTRLWEKSGKMLYTVRSDNWNEKLGRVSADEVCLMAGGVEPGKPLAPVTLRDFLAKLGQHGAYAGLQTSTDLRCSAMDAAVSIRFQTTFLPVADEKQAALEFCPEMYNYQTRSDDDPRNLLLLCTTQGSAIQQDGAGAKKLFHHAVEPGAKKGEVCRYWFEAERTSHAVGGAQKESAEEKADAIKRGKATAAVIGTKAMGTRFNVLMTIQVPLAQKRKAQTRGGGGGGGGGGGYLDKLKSYSLSSSGFSSCSDDDEELCDEGDVMKASGFAGLEVGASANSMMLCKAAPGSRAAAPKRRAAPPKGSASAARVSRGSLHDRWKGLGLTDPKRNESEHVTVTVVIYNTVAGGVPSAADVRAAVDDMEALYGACGWNGKLASSGAAFMKSELTVAQVVADIGAKLAQQPYTPPGQEVTVGETFPTSSSLEAPAPAAAAPSTELQPQVIAGVPVQGGQKCAIM